MALRKFLILFFLASGLNAKALSDSTKTSAKITIEGMIGVSFNRNTFTFNIGGPYLKVRFSKNFSAGLGGFPSLFISEKRVEPKLGISPRIDYKRFAFFAPVFHFTNPNTWVYTVGFGYKFH